MVSVGARPAKAMDRWLQDFWPKLLNARAAFDRDRSFAVGTPVQSTYQRRWFGRVHGPGMSSGCVVVERTHDEGGRPHRKVTFAELSKAWLRRV